MALEQQESGIASMPPQHLANNPNPGFPVLLTCQVAALLVPGYFAQPLTGGLVLSMILSLLLLSALYLVAYQLRTTGILPPSPE